MAYIITSGIARNIKTLASGAIAFSLCENTGTKDRPNYIYYDCISKLTEKQAPFLTENKIIEVVGVFSTNIVEKDGKTYENKQIAVSLVNFKGSIDKNE